jgi:hypothetical protein
MGQGVVAMSKKEVLFVSWCPLKLLRPRAIQVGRAGKALRLHDWRPTLICAEFKNYTYLFDSEVESWYKSEFAKIIAPFDSDFQLDPSAGRDGRSGLQSWLRAKLNHFQPPRAWTDSASDAIGSWARWRRHPIVISFAQPWTSHLAVLAAKRRYPRLRWAAHFSDPWVDSPYLAHADATELETAGKQEREIIGRADAVIFVTEETADLVMRKYPPEWRRKVHVIPHLLDLELPSVPKRERQTRDRLKFVHSGSLYDGARAPNGLFEALRDLQRIALPPGLALTFRFVGWTRSGALRSLRGTKLEDCVAWTTPLYYSQSLKELSNADVLVVIDADFEASPFLPSKIFDYLLFDKPMLALTPAGSATARFMRQLGYPSAAPNDIEAIKKILTTMIDTWKAGMLQPTAAHIEARGAYDVRVAGGRYVEVVESLSQ